MFLTPEEVKWLECLVLISRKSNLVCQKFIVDFLEMTSKREREKLIQASIDPYLQAIVWKGEKAKAPINYIILLTI